MKLRHSKVQQSSSKKSPSSFISKPGERFIDSFSRTTQPFIVSDQKNTVSERQEAMHNSSAANHTPVPNLPSATPVPAPLTPTVTFDTIDSTSTPAKMGLHRIPPRIAQAVNYKVANLSEGTEIGSSNFFSVSAIPQNLKSTFRSLLTGAQRGFDVVDNWESDSGVIADLDQTEISEQVQYHSGTGIFKGFRKGINSGYLPGNKFSIDTHGIVVDGITGEGTVLTNQTTIFKDLQTGANNVSMKNTGYNLSRTVMESAPKSGDLEITTTKEGANTTANGYTSAAGAGKAISEKQSV